ncbi:hypothetical protein J4E83_001140 [Alternaria metachromatica]|uniref:uncharacterized protein n=1 Tax=Alternaria metachromatica TaxID=283354 RepID=UPI0020C2500F|nr:uncharacterized protein J4E83_001140 [Alternaria metachromatica]KAI4636186.1 hypothetical protein J4E83_001140 [Alternaria metachromatica]
MRVVKIFAAFCACSKYTAHALLEEKFVGFEPGDQALDVAGATVIADADDFVGIHIALNSLVNDFEQIAGTRPALKNATTNSTFSTSSTGIIVGSVGSRLIRHLSSEKGLDISDLEGKWEVFKTAVIADPIAGVERALVIVGSDKRGTIFGVHTLAEQSGQSPYHWWADVPTKKHAAIFALPKVTVHGPPSVKYRGLFINDEAPALVTWWAARHNSSHYPLDTEFYAHVFDLLLRLKANYLWPAMWGSTTPAPGHIFFTDDPGNQQLANDYGIVISTSHHEPMQRATNEWNATETGPWDWRLNKDNVTRFMEEGIRRMGNNESYVTLGMRGPSDSAIVGDDALEILREVFEVERQIFKEVLGDQKVNQAWTIYKEVATYYAAGLNPPDDVTIIMPDDNHGQILRLPTGNETAREGGAGVYFHFEYFGRPRSYKWSNTNSLVKLLQAYWRDANQVWVINVGDVKPLELPFGFAMDLAWDISKFDFDMIPEYLRLYAEREFGMERADDIAALLMEFNYLIGMRRFEMVQPDTYSVLNYHEAETVLTRWNTLARGTKTLYDQMPDDHKAAFYELLFYPLVSGATYYAVNVRTGMNYRHAMERRNSANALAHQILADFEYDYDLVEGFDAVLNGKWLNIMSQAKLETFDTTKPKNWMNPSRDIVSNLSFVQLRQNMQFSVGNLGIYAEGSNSPLDQGRWAESIDPSMPFTKSPAKVPEMSPYGPRQRTIDLFMRGDYRVPLDWQLGDIPVDWLSITPSSGELNQTVDEQRLNITIDWTRVPEGYNDTVEVGVTSTPSFYPYYDIIHVPVNNFKVPGDFLGFPETAGYISIESPHYQRSSLHNGTANNTVSFTHTPYLGSRTESGSIAIRPFHAARASLEDATKAFVEYDIYLFNHTTALNATIYITACLDTDPNLLMEFSLSLDDTPQNFTRVLGDPEDAGDVPPEWTSEVMNQVWTRKVSLGEVAEGKHTLRWSVNSPEVYLEKLVLDTRGGVKDSYLGPPETMMVGYT